MPTIIHQRIRAANAGTDLAVVCRVPSGVVVMGEFQYLRGYCLLLPDPVVSDLNALVGVERAQFLADMATVGDAIIAVTGAVRCNYELLGNLAPALHAHIFPRFSDEPDAFRTLPPMQYPDEIKNAAPFDPVRERGLMERIAASIAVRCRTVRSLIR